MGCNVHIILDTMGVISVSLKKNQKRAKSNVSNQNLNFGIY